MPDLTQPLPHHDGNGISLAPKDPAQLGRFTLRRRLGAGGMGIAYVAVSDTGIPVVVKTLRHEHAANAAYRQRFRREILAASSVRSSFTAPVLASDLDAARQWVAIAFVPGPTLDTLVDEVGPLQDDQLAALALALAEGLSQLHALRLVHRDLKPANIICADDGPRLIDFGIAEFEHDDLLTVRELGAMGSPGWIAPERLSGPRPPASSEDIYAWACVCWYAATGQHPPTEGRPWEPSDIDRERLPSQVCDLLLGALDPDPACRPAAGEIVARLGSSDPAVPAIGVVTRAWGAEDSPTQRFRTRVAESGAEAASVPAGAPRRPAPRWLRGALALPAAALIAAASIAVVDATGGNESPSAAKPSSTAAGGPASTPAASAAPPSGSTAARQTTRPRGVVTATVTATPSSSTASPRLVSRCDELDFPVLPYPSRPLSLADQPRFSPHVRGAQDSLNYLGYGCLDEDGYFGPATRDAILLFQRDYGLEATGVLDDVSWSTLQSLALVGADGCIEPC